MKGTVKFVVSAGYLGLGSGHWYTGFTGSLVIGMQCFIIFFPLFIIFHHHISSPKSNLRANNTHEPWSEFSTQIPFRCIARGYGNKFKLRSDPHEVTYSSTQWSPFRMNIISPLTVDRILDFIERFRSGHPISRMASLKFCAGGHEVFIDKIFDRLHIRFIF